MPSSRRILIQFLSHINEKIWGSSGRPGNAPQRSLTKIDGSKKYWKPCMRDCPSWDVGPGWRRGSATPARTLDTFAASPHTASALTSPGNRPVVKGVGDKNRQESPRRVGVRPQARTIWFSLVLSASLGSWGVAPSFPSTDAFAPPTALWHCGHFLEPS